MEIINQKPFRPQSPLRPSTHLTYESVKIQYKDHLQKPFVTMLQVPPRPQSAYIPLKIAIPQLNTHKPLKNQYRFSDQNTKIDDDFILQNNLLNIKDFLKPKIKKKFQQFYQQQIIDYQQMVQDERRQIETDIKKLKAKVRPSTSLKHKIKFDW